jgi:hypothetical protein
VRYPVRLYGPPQGADDRLLAHDRIETPGTPFAVKSSVLHLINVEKLTPLV